MRILPMLAFTLTLCGALQAQDKRLVTFGLITDTHVCDKGDQSPAITVNAAARYFTGGLGKLEAFAKAMNQADVSFIAELGDFTDNPVGATLAPEARRTAALGFAQAAEARMALFQGPRYHVFGNHDTDQASKKDYLSRITNTGIAPQATYYSWNASGVHFVALDASFKADGSSYSGRPGEPGHGYTWDEAHIPAEELAWLKQDLSATPLPTVILTHQLLNPLEQIDAAYDPHHTVRNAAEVRSVIEKSGRVIAIFSGHYHDGGLQYVNGIPYLALQANAAYGNDPSYHNQFARIEVTQEGRSFRILVEGHGGQKSHVLRTTL